MIEDVHVMIDLETMGKSADTVFVSIGACKFDSQGILGKFYANIDWNQEGRTWNGDTVKWWMKQNQEAKNALIQDGKPMEDVLEDFRAWLTKTYIGDTLNNSDPIVWGNGATFDISILEHAYGRMNTPWKFRNVRDMRTMVALTNLSYPLKSGVAHNALDDAVYQAEFIVDIFKELGKENVLGNYWRGIVG